MGTAPGTDPRSRPSRSCPGWAAAGLAAVTLAIRVSSAVPPLLAAMVARAYGQRECRCAQWVKEVTTSFLSPPRLRSSLPSCRLAVLPSPLPLHHVRREPDQ